MKLQATLVCLLDHDSKRVKAGVCALFAGRQIGPGEQFRLVQRIAEGTHLCNHGIQSQLLDIVERLLDIFGKLCFPHTLIIFVQQHRLQVEVGQPNRLHLLGLLFLLGLPV